ncbi:MAG TPA: enoyl-CoA hydratase-related protein [Solirubrobacteraceae bacterium]|nr:enoyl-CoA hydratase-related protein [Solirubrobacteraceae bacterium]
MPLPYEIAAAHETVTLWRAGGAAKIELNRPDSLNAWNAQLSADLWAAFEAVRAVWPVRAVLLTGAGRAFCSGADLKSMGDGALLRDDGSPDLQRSLRERYHPVLTGLRRLEKPVVAAVNGPAVGVGMSLALTADLVVARPSAYFLLAFVNIGLVPDGGSSAFVPARIGVARAAEMALLGERVGAEKAREWGLINRVIEDADWDAEVDALVARLAAGPTRSYAGSKRQLNAWAYERLDEQLELEAAVQQEMAGSADFAEGVTAFLAKRPAVFTGR